MGENDGYSYEDYQRMHKLEAMAARTEQTSRQIMADLAELQRQVLDLKARGFADSCEREIELARWQDGIAARVGSELEGVADKVMLAIERGRRGEDVDGLLFDVHTDLLAIAADLMTVNPDEGEGC